MIASARSFMHASNCTRSIVLMARPVLCQMCHTSTEYDSYEKRSFTEGQWTAIDRKLAIDKYYCTVESGIGIYNLSFKL